MADHNVAVENAGERSVCRDSFFDSCRRCVHTVTPTPGATYSTAGDLLSNGFIYDGQPHIYRVDLLLNVVGSTLPSEAFSDVIFDIKLTGGVTRNTLQLPGSGLTVVKARFTPNNPPLSNLVDQFGRPYLNEFEFAGDDVTSGNDFKNIEIINSPNVLGHTFDAATGLAVPDPRLTIGKSSPFLLGTVYVLGGMTPGHLLT